MWNDSSYRPTGAAVIVCGVVPHLPPVVKVLHNLRRILDVTLRDLLVQRQSVDRPDALL